MECLDEDTILAFVDLELTAAVAADVENHIDVCPACRGVVAAVIRGRTLGAPPADVPAATSDDRASRYSILREHGRGAQARVMVAADQLLGREVALKELLTEVGDPTVDAATGTVHAAARFVSEARITGRMSHPGVVPVHDIGELANGRPYYTMQLVRGRTLAEALRSCNGLDERLRLLGHFVDLCQTVAYAHSRGVLHRDIKPHNVMVGEFGETVLLDWGLAKTRAPRHAAANDRSVSDARRTLDGTVVGTPAYMSPEQAAGDLQQTDERSDVFSLGAVLYELLTGEPPFSGSSLPEILEAVREARIKPVRELEPNAPGELIAIVDTALSRHKTQRYDTVSALVRDVDSYLTGARVGAYDYSPWEVLKRFASRHKVLVWAGATAALTVVVALVGMRQAELARVRDELATARQEYERLDIRVSALDDKRQSAFDSFDRGNPESAESRWADVLIERRALRDAYDDLLAELRAVLASEPQLENALALRLEVLKRMATFSDASGRHNLSAHYQKLIGEAGGDDIDPAAGSANIASNPAGATISLTQSTSGTSADWRDVGTTPVANLTLESGSYIARIEKPGFEPVIHPFVVESNAVITTTVVLHKPGALPAGMVFIPAGEFVVGSAEPEEVRQYTGSVPRHTTYARGFVISATEVSLAEYLPFLRVQPPAKRTQLTPGGPYSLDGVGTSAPRLTFNGRTHGWGESLELADCTDCKPQDWRQWPAFVSVEAAGAFAAWKTRELQRGGVALELRLPSEAEWEKAARGADGRTYPTGEVLPSDAAATLATHGRAYIGPQAVGTHPTGASPFGVHDLAGNAWEWVRVADDGSIPFAIKGGSFADSPVHAVSSGRVLGGQVTPSHRVGFRLAAYFGAGDPCQLGQPLPTDEILALAEADSCLAEAIRVYDRGNLDLAVKRCHRSRALFASVRGEADPAVADLDRRLGGLYRKQGMHKEAAEHLERAVATATTTLGERDLRTAEALTSLADLVGDRGDYEEAGELFEKALHIRRDVLGAKHIKVAASYNDLAIIAYRRNDPRGALERFNQAVAVATYVYGSDHPEVASGLNNLSIVYQKLGEHDLSFAKIKDAVVIKERVYGTEHIKTASSYANLAWGLKNRGDYKEAVLYARRALAITAKSLGTRAVQTAKAHGTLGGIYWEMGDLENALKEAQRCASIARGVLPENHWYVVRQLIDVGFLHDMLGDAKAAAENYREALPACRDQYEDAHPSQCSRLYVALADTLTELDAPDILDRAIEVGQAGCEKEPDACVVAALARCGRGQCDDEAKRLIDTVLDSNVTDPDALEARAVHFRAQNKPEEARDLYCRIKGKFLNLPAARRRLAGACP